MKKTRKTKQIAAFAAAVVMAACTAMPMSMMSASAEELKTYTITVNAAAETGATKGLHDYTAYQIFSATGITKAGSLEGINWGTGVKTMVSNVSIYEALANLGVVKKVTDDDQNVTETYFTSDGKELAEDKSNLLTTAAGVVSVLQSLDDDSEALDKVAGVFQSYINSDGAKLDTFSAGKVAEGTGAAVDATYTIDVTGLGYYLVTDSITTNTTGQTASKYLLYVEGTADSDGNYDVTVKPKADSPTVIKKIKENTNLPNTVGNTVALGSIDEYELEANYNDTADFCIGDAVPFKLYGTLPSTYDSYTTYKYAFHDSLGTEFTAPSSIDDITVKITTTVEGTEKTYVVTSGCKKTIADNKIDIKFGNLKATKDGYLVQGYVEGHADKGTVDIPINSGSIITAEYTAVLSTAARIGRPGQQNAVNLEYSNNPYSTSEGFTDDTTDTNTTPDDKVIAFTYELDLTKIDGVSKDELTGAEFQLKNADGEFAKLSKGSDLQDASNKDKYDANKWYLTGWGEESDATTLTGLSAGSTYDIVGLDAGTYTLKETKAPTGYKLPESEFTFIITANTNNTQNDNDITGEELTELALYEDEVSDDTVVVKYTYEAVDSVNDDENTQAKKKANNDAVAAGIVAGKITNTSSMSLPSTGGIGTTVFYVTGGVLVAGAGVLLITKKRTKKDDAE
jgi:LPXTG-motif cell wall-anchored protein